jgi:hypothetical protein
MSRHLKRLWQRLYGRQRPQGAKWEKVAKLLNAKVVSK